MPVRRRMFGLLAVPTLVLGAAIPAAAQGTASPTTALPNSAAAGWLARQLVDGDHFEAVFDGTAYPDQGLTADAVLAFAAGRASDAAAAKATAWLARPEVMAGYVGDGTTESYAGATAKLLLTAEVRGVDPTSFGGADLPARLRALQAANGRFSDRSQYGDFSNSFGQSLAVIALQRTPGGAPAAAVDFLVGTRCADGGFPSDLGGTTCVGDPDATALAAQALEAVGRTADVRPALDWLTAHQNADGGFGAAGAATSNANTTGLATEALLAGGRVVAALRGEVELLRLQQGCSADASVRGAIAYDAGGFNATTAVRATAQAALGLGGVPLYALSAQGSRSEAPVLVCPTVR